MGQIDLLIFSKLYIPPLLTVKNLCNFQITETTLSTANLQSLLFAKPKKHLNNRLLKYELLVWFLLEKCCSAA